MASEWPFVSLQQVCQEIYRYPSFYGMEKYDNGVPVVRGEHLLSDGTISTDWSDYWFVSEEYAQRFPKTRLGLHDIVMSVRGSIGTFSKVGPKHVGAQISPNLIRISPNPDLIEPAYLYYALRGSAACQFIASTTSSSAVPAIRGADIKLAEIPLPTRREQRAIAHILGTLDDKIELNRQMNETLEEMARALFKSWFVDFDPVRAKMDGRWRKGQSLPGLPVHLWDLFPDKLVDSELGKIPEGWRVCSIGDFALVTSGKRPDSLFNKSCERANVPLWGGNGPMGFVSEPLFYEPILLTGRVGTLGSVFRITAPCWPSDNTLVVQPFTKNAFEYLYFCMKNFDFEALNRGSTQPGL